mgnify:CR=1 FL=1
MALAAKMDEADYKTYVLMGDGEQEKVPSMKLLWQETNINWIIW